MKLNKTLINEILEIIKSAQVKAIRSIDRERVLRYWQIGKEIFEDETYVWKENK